MKNSHKIGAVFFILWGIIHIIGGSFIMLQSDSVIQLAMIGTGRSPETFQALSNDVLNGVLSYHGFNIVWLGIFAIVIAVKYNWKNIKIGFWLNVLVIGVVELGMLLFQLMPGYNSWADGGIGFGLYIAALIFSSIGIASSNKAH